MRTRLTGLATLLFFALPAVALAADESSSDEDFNPADEWDLHEWIPIHIGPLDLSINKAVAYLLLGALVACLIGVVLMRVKVGRDPTRRQAVGETIYEVAQVQIAEQGLPTKAIARMSSCSVNARPASSPSPCTTLSTPGGNPSSSAICARSSALTGLHSAGLCTTVQPAASAGAIFHVESMKGVFHGVITPTGPIGVREV